MRRSKRTRLAGVVLASVLLVSMLGLGSGTIAVANGAPSGISWDPMRLGQSQIDQYYWAETARNHVYNSGLDNVVMVEITDHDPVDGYPQPYCVPDEFQSCPFKMGVLSEQHFAYSNWESTSRLNDTSENGSRPAIASDVSTGGTWNYVAYVTQSSYYDSKVGTGPRSLNVVANLLYGYQGRWGTPVALTGPNSKIDYPSIAAAQNKVWVVYTDAKTGKIWLADSTDQGLTWTMNQVGTTKRMALGPYPYGAGGYEGRPEIAVTPDGMGMIMAWIANADGKVRAKVSTDGGATWAGKRLAKKSAARRATGLRNTALPTVDAIDGRMAVSWIIADGSAVRVREVSPTDGTWSSQHKAATLDDNAGAIFNSASVSLNGPSTIAVAWAGCVDAGCSNYGGKAQGSSIYYAESADNGATYSDPDLVAGPAEDQTLLNNETPQVLFKSGGERWVRWYTYDSTWYKYQMMERFGLGGGVN